ncbi:hypothetical protein [Dendrosporobacter sp. 1207_IL3150]|uniref:hypothetical protein n=1 Tax=Dendrosporobacter sp. 1207_IL3150 TaxID=3084054 RepID=UPI002FD8D36F
MPNIEDALDRIRALECPTTAIKRRVAGILLYYEVANKSDINVIREHSLDKNGARGYTAKISGDNSLDIVVLARSGQDDYVAKVVDAYLS